MRPLAPKEAAAFKEMFALYEGQNYRRALKSADQILKKSPDHGETICMKGLLLTHVGRRDEGIELVKQGMVLNLQSSICWHVFALIQSAENNYHGALKSYTQALRFDKDNLNILRDTARLQSQLRLFDALVDTRHAILRLRPNFRQHWVALAVAHHLNGNLNHAILVLNYYQLSLKDIPDFDVEYSETLLYHIRILELAERYSEALVMLDRHTKDRTILDRTASMENRARLLTTLHAPEAESAWRALIDHNPDNNAYYIGYLAQKNLSLDPQAPDASQALALLQSLSSQNPRASVPKRLSLFLASGSTFQSLITPYLLAALEKGIPSLFSDLKSLYTHPEKQHSIQAYLESLLDTTDQPSTYLWILYYLAQHHSYLSDHSLALHYLHLAITHTPTLPDLHMVKARVLKRCGDLVGAARAVNEARLLDGQDRFLNTKTGKYLLRAACVNEARQIFGLFTKKDAPSPAYDLEEMQSFLYLLEEANAHRINAELNLALKKYMAVIKVFENFEHDQFDFHGYSLRKFTLNVYLNFISWEDSVRAHAAYVKAALAASQILIAVHDDPSLATPPTTTPELSEAAKKAKKKAKKAASKAAANEADKKGQQNPNEDKGLVPPSKDDDPEGTKLLSSPDGLEIAAKLLRPLTNLLASSDINVRAKVEGIVKNKERMEIWLLSYDVAIRRRKLLQALTFLTHAQSLFSSHPGLHLRLVHLHHFIATILRNQTPPAPIGPAFIEGVKQLGVPDENQVSLETYNLQYLQKHTADYCDADDIQRKVNPAEATLACARAMMILGTPLSEVEDILLGLIRLPPSRKRVSSNNKNSNKQKQYGFNELGLTISIALDVIRCLEDQVRSKRVKEFKEGCQRIFDQSTVFLDTEELNKLKGSVLDLPEGLGPVVGDD